VMKLAAGQPGGDPTPTSVRWSASWRDSMLW